MIHHQFYSIIIHEASIRGYKAIIRSGTAGSQEALYLRQLDTSGFDYTRACHIVQRRGRKVLRTNHPTVLIPERPAMQRPAMLGRPATSKEYIYDHHLRTLCVALPIF